MKTSNLTKRASSLSGGLCLTVSLLGLAAGGCAVAAGEPSQAGAACTASVETRIHTSRVASNGIPDNGTSLNGIQSNGASLNGVRLSDVTIGSARLDRVDLTADGELVGWAAESKLSGDALVGATLQAMVADGRAVEVTISSFLREGDRATYGVEHEGVGLCADGTGLFVPGVWDETGARHDERVVDGARITTTFSCRTGAIAKCVLWGYAPGVVGADLHQACTRMVRADYCGTGTAFTKNGTAIDIYDARGIQAPAGDASFLFEAGWSANGAACVARTRYDERTPQGEARLPSCWSTLPSCGSLAEAGAFGALVANSSRLQSSVVCP